VGNLVVKWGNLKKKNNQNNSYGFYVKVLELPWLNLFSILNLIKYLDDYYYLP